MQGGVVCAGVRTVLCHGVFDLTHIGHVEHFREAREFGDRLVVSVVPDAFLTKSRNVIYDEQTRRKMVLAIRYVDFAVLCDGPGPQDVIERLRPDVYVRGPEYIGDARPEDALLAKLGIPTRYTASVYPRATEIVNKIVASSAIPIRAQLV